MVAELRVPTDDGASLSVMISGEGRALVLCHGGPGLWDYFDDLAHDLEDLVTVVRWDQRGCGRSTGGREPHSVARYVEDLDTIRAALDLDRWIVGGHSWGAAIGSTYTVSHRR
jgi:proline iminopeptidase